MPRDKNSANPAPGLLGGVHELVSTRVRAALQAVDLPAPAGTPIPGGLLMTRMAARLTAGGDGPVLEHACAAAEIAHLATLCHGEGAGAALRCAGDGPSAAVLMGDVLLCQALDLIVTLAGGRYILTFTQKVHEVCSARAERELMALRGGLDAPSAVRLARGMGGGLFSFTARLCDGRDPALAAAMEEAGYRVGTACHLAGAALPGGLRAEAERQCASALDCLAGWPLAHGQMAEFVAEDVAPLLKP